MASCKADTSNYVRCHEAIQLVCHRAASLVDNVLHNWHSSKKQTIQPCRRPKPRPPANPQECSDRGKPKLSSSCQNCVAWGVAVEAEYYPQSLKGAISWGNINPACLSKSYMQVAKAFVLRLQQNKIFVKAADFDSASLLMLMMHFGEFHKNDHTSYEVIKEVSSIRNTLSHMKLEDNLQLSDQLLNTYFSNLHDLVSCLERLYPLQFKKTDADDVRSKMNEILQSPVTVSMTEKSLRPLTDTMKEVVFKTMEDQFREHSQIVTTTIQQEFQMHSSGLRKQVEQQFGKQMQEIEQGMIDGFQGTTEVLSKRLGQKMQDLKDDRDKRATGFVKDLERLDQEEIQTLRRILKKKYMRERKDIRFGQNRRAIADTDDIFVDLELLTDEESTMESDGHSSYREECSGSNEYEVGVSSKQRAKCRKINSYQALLTLVDKHKQSLHHILVRGNAGCGKTTLMSKIAYEWAKTVKPNKPSIPGSQAPKALVPALCDIELILVLDARKFKRDQTLSQAIQKQLLPGVSINIDKLLSSLGESCLILIDGFDELPKDITDHALDSPHLSECFVVVTTRPHKVDEFCVVHKGYVHVKISGFSRENSFKYVRKFFCNAKQPELAKTLTENILNKPILTILSSFPILLVMLCLLWKHLPKKAVCLQSMTRLYGEAMKYLNKPFEKPERSIDHILCMLGEPALKALFENNLQISSDEFADKELLKQSFEIGLAFEEEDELVDAASVTFIHKTFQEYCAAFYLASLLGKDKDKFHYYLSCINESNVDEVEYLLRFCCGLNVEAGGAILLHVFKLCGNSSYTKFNRLGPPKFSIYEMMKFSRLRLPMILLYERKVSCNIDPSPKLLHTYVKELGKYDKLDIFNAEVIAAISHFATETNAIAGRMFGNIKNLNYMHGFGDATTMMKVLRCMPSLVKVEVVGDKLNGELLDEHTLPLSKSLTYFEVTSNYGPPYTLDVVQVVRILRCIPSLETATLRDINLIGKLVGNPPLLSKSVEHVNISGSEYCADMSLVSLVSLLRCMQSLICVKLTGFNLIDDLGQNTPLLSKSLKRFIMLCAYYTGNVSIAVLTSFLRCMPSLEEVFLSSVKLTGKLSEDTPPLSSSLNKFSIARFLEKTTVNVTTLVNFLRYMPALVKVKLLGVNLMGQLSGNIPFLSKSLKHFTMVGDFACNWESCAVDVVQLSSVLKCMPSLETIKLKSIRLIGELDEDIPLSKSLREFSIVINKFPGYQPEDKKYPQADSLGILDNHMSVVTLVSFLRCMSSLEKVKLKNVSLEGELIENIPLGKSLVDVSMDNVQQMGLPTNTGNPLDDFYSGRERTLNVVTLLSVLRCMPSILRVKLERIRLAGKVIEINPPLSESLEDLTIVGDYHMCPFVEVGTLVSLLSCMPSLTKLNLMQVSLTGELDEVTPQLNTSLQDITFEGESDLRPILSVGTLFSFLRCMPLLEKVKLKYVSLTDGFVKNIPLSMSLIDFNIDNVREMDVQSFRKDSEGNFHTVQGNFVCVATFVRVLQCMPSLRRVKLESVCLVGDVVGNASPLLYSLHDLTIVEHNPKCHVLEVVTVVTLLRCMPSLTKLKLVKVDLHCKWDEIIQLNASLQDIIIEGESGLKSSGIMLFCFLRCMPYFARVRLQSINLSDGLIEFRRFTGTVISLVTLLKYIVLLPKDMNIDPVCLTGEMNETTITLNKSRKYLPIERETIVYILLAILQCMPLRSKVKFKDFNLND